MGKTEDWSEELSVEIANDIKRRNGGTMERWKEVRKKLSEWEWRSRSVDWTNEKEEL